MNLLRPSLQSRVAGQSARALSRRTGVGLPGKPAGRLLHRDREKSLARRRITSQTPTAE